MTGPLREHGALARGAFAVAVLVSLAVLFAPPGDVPSSPPGVDKVVHAVLFRAHDFHAPPPIALEAMRLAGEGGGSLCGRS